MKTKYKHLPLLAALLLVGCSKPVKEETIKVAQAEPTTGSMSSSQEATEQPSSSTEQVPQTELSRSEKALLTLETTTPLSKEQTEEMKSRLEAFLAHIKEANTLADTEGQNDYLMSKELFYDFKVDYLTKGYQVDKVVMVKSKTDDVWQAMITLKNTEGQEAYYSVHYNTLLEKFVFFYRDSVLDETTRGE